MIKSFILIIFALISAQVNAQSIDELMFPNSEIVKKSKIEVGQLLLSIKDSLELTKKDIRVRKFELEPCNELLQFMSNKDLYADATDFLNNNTCQGIYSFQHRTNKNGSHYRMDFYFNEKGVIVNKKIIWMMVIP